MSEKRAQLKHDLEGAGVVVGNTRFLLHQGLATATWQWKVASDGVGTECDDTKPDETLSADNVRRVMEEKGGEDGIHGEELRIYASDDLMERLAGIVDNMLRKQRRERLRETLTAGPVVLGGLTFRVADFAADTWQTSEDKRLRTHGAGIEDDLTLTTMQGILRAKPEGVSWDVLVSESLVERACMVVEELEDAPDGDERRPGIYVDDLDLEREGGFTIGATTFRVTREMDGPVWRFSPNGIVHGQSTLTRDSILQQIDKADGRPLEVLAAPDLAEDLLKVTREVLAEAIRRGWTITPGMGQAYLGDATTFEAGQGHMISGLATDEAETLQTILTAIREDPEGAVAIFASSEKEQHERFVEALNRGLLPVYLNAEMAAHCIHRGGEDPKLVFGEMPDVRAARHLASGIDQALRAAEPPMRSVTLAGAVTVDDDGDLCIDGKDVIQALALLDESLVGFDLTGPETHIELAGGLDLLEGGMGDEPHEDGPGWLKVGSLDLLPILTKLVGEKVVMSVVESLRTATVHPTAEEPPKTAEEDLVGKIRVALTAGKLIQANGPNSYEAPPGSPPYLGAPSRKNDTAVDRLTEALAWAEQDAAEKVPAPE